MINIVKQAQSKDTNTSEKILEELSKYSDAPKKFLSDYKTLYEKYKKDLIESNNELFENTLSLLIENFKPFVILDWANILSELIRIHHPLIFCFMGKLKLEEVLPQKIEENYVFKAYQELIEDEVLLKQMKNSLADNYKERFHIFSDDTENNFINLEAEKQDKSFYIISLQCASYVRSFGQTSKINTLDVSENIIITKGLEYQSSIPFDNLVYWEI